MIIASSISHIFRTITSSIIYKSYTEIRVGQQLFVFFFLKATKYIMMMIRTLPTNDPITAPVINPPLDVSVK
jgi:hypothetical protein